MWTYNGHNKLLGAESLLKGFCFLGWWNSPQFIEREISRPKHSVCQSKTVQN